MSQTIFSIWSNKKGNPNLIWPVKACRDARAFHQSVSVGRVCAGGVRNFDLQKGN